MCATSGRHSCIRYDTSQSAAFCSAVLFCWTRKLCIVWRSAKLALRILRDASYQIKIFEFIEGQNPPTVRTVRTQQSLSLERASQCLCRAAQAPSRRPGPPLSRDTAASSAWMPALLPCADELRHRIETQLAMTCRYCLSSAAWVRAVVGIVSFAL